jgi:DMSO/TMAO reductase YedYZ molybdopterin-dependent catalytic subunit
MNGDDRPDGREPVAPPDTESRNGHGPDTPEERAPEPATVQPVVDATSPVAATPAEAGDAPAAAPDAEAAPAAAAAPAPVAPAPHGFFAERPEDEFDVPRTRLAAQSRRDFVLFAAGLLAAASGAWVLLPERAKSRLKPGPVHDRLDTLAARVGLTPEKRERLLNRSLTFDDDIAEALYSKDRAVRTYDARQVTMLRNNYHGRTPTAAMVADWRLELGGLAGGGRLRLTRDELLKRFPLRGQVTRFVCVEGWSAIAAWGGIRFAELLAAFPPAPGMRWAAMRSEIGLDGAGRPDPYFVSIDLETARHPQSLLATHQGGQPLTLAHGWPLRLVVPMKLGLKNIKAITHIEYVADEPRDYWNERGYSKYDGL